MNPAASAFRAASARQKMVRLLTAWATGQGSAGDLALIDELSEALRLTWIYHIGQVVPAPVPYAAETFPR